ncbi:MAG: small multi-drug export protein [candidate division Zixibacteria bacterium]
MPDIAYALILSLLPIAELRGGIPYALLSGYPIWLSYIGCVAANFLVGPMVFVFLNTLHKLFYGISIYKGLFDWFERRVRRKTAHLIEKYGFWGVAIFVAIPLPITGAYTGSFAAWLFKLDFKRSMLAVMVGVIISGIIVTAVMTLGIEWLMPLFTKQFD